MAKSKYEQQHEQDLRIIADQLKEAKEVHDLCDEGFREVIEQINSLISKPLVIDLEVRKGGQITLEMDVSGVPVNVMDGYREMHDEQHRELENILHKAAHGFLKSIGAQLDSTNLSTDLRHD